MQYTINIIGDHNNTGFIHDSIDAKITKLA